MEEGKLAQVLQKVALPGILMAILLSQVVASLRCYSCMDVNDGGCAADRIKIEECTPPRNVCLEAITIVVIDKQNVSAAIKGCDIGIHHNQEHQVGGFITSYRRVRAHACSEDLCNSMVVTEDFLRKPPHIQNGSSVPNDRECYSCISTSKDQCSSHNAAVVKCQDHSPVCYQGIGTIVLGHQHNITLSYSIKECAQTFCNKYSSDASEYENRSETGSCCHSNLCNGLAPHDGLRAASFVAPLIGAALMSIASFL